MLAAAAKRALGPPTARALLFSRGDHWLTTPCTVSCVPAARHVCVAPTVQGARCWCQQVCVAGVWSDWHSVHVHRHAVSGLPQQDMLVPESAHGVTAHHWCLQPSAHCSFPTSFHDSLLLAEVSLCPPCGMWCPSMASGVCLMCCRLGCHACVQDQRGHRAIPSSQQLHRPAAPWAAA
jgi:hypothetical protein